MKASHKTTLHRGGLIALGLLAAAIAFAVVDGWRAFGSAARGERASRVQASPQWKDGKFVNPEPLRNDWWGSLAGVLDVSDDVSPSGPLPMVHPGSALRSPPATGLRATWLGHSTVLVEIDGARVLTDPVWSERASPLGWLGPRRWYSPPIALAELPKIDAVVISHDHYDHMDHPSIVSIANMPGWDTKFVVPLGLGAHLAYWGVPEARIVELDWWEEAKIGGDGLVIVGTPARHASGRMGIDNDEKLWGGFALIGARHRVYYSGDTGLFPGMNDIGARLGPFDLTMLEVGQYGSAWPDWHLGPEQAVRAHQMVRGRVMLPVHWGTFALAFHGWTEPIERVLIAGKKAGVTLLAPKPGQSVEPEAAPALERWWPRVPWRTAEENPINATQVPPESPPTGSPAPGSP